MRINFRIIPVPRWLWKWLTCMHVTDAGSRSERSEQQRSFSRWGKSQGVRSDLTSHGTVGPGKMGRACGFLISIILHQDAFAIWNKQRSLLSFWSQGLTFTSDLTSGKKYKMSLSTKDGPRAQDYCKSSVEENIYNCPIWSIYFN